MLPVNYSPKYTVKWMMRDIFFGNIAYEWDEDIIS